MSTKSTLGILFLLLHISVLKAQTNFSRDPLNPMVTGASTAITNICDASVLYDNGMFRMWAGCIEADTSYASICYSESADGSNWTVPIIVFTPSNIAGAWDNSKTEIPTVIKDGTEPDPLKRYKMWYGGADSLAPNVVDSMGYAYSPDGLSWTRLPAAQSPFGQDGLVLEPGITNGDAGVVSDPTVLKVGATYHVWYNSFGIGDSLYISHATSANGINWVRDPSNPVLGPTEIWEAQGPGPIAADVSHPSVLWNGSQYMMWYGSFDSTNFVRYDGIAYATSSDGTNWTKEVNNPIFMPDLSKPGEQIGISSGPNVVRVGNTFHLYYCAINGSAVRNILHASDATVGMVEQSNEHSILLYPNPFSEAGVLLFDGQKGGGYTLSIYDVQGRLVRAITAIATGKVEIKRNGLDPGPYLFELRSVDQVEATGRLVIE